VYSQLPFQDERGGVLHGSLYSREPRGGGGGGIATEHGDGILKQGGREIIFFRLIHVILFVIV